MSKAVLPKFYSFAAVLLVFTLFSALFFEAFHADHDSARCQEENCPICMVMQIVRTQIQFPASSAAVQQNAPSAFASLLCIILSLYTISVTPITQKTKLTI